MTVDVLYEDNHLLVVNKPPKVLSQGDATGDDSIIDWAKDYLKKKYNKPGNVFVGLVHRIDRPVSGVLVLARTSKALSRLNKQFQERSTQKTYWAVVEQAPSNPIGRLEHFLMKNSKQLKSYASGVQKPGSKKAILTYRFLGSSDAYHLLEVKPETGRHHQIRVQLASIECVIKGDLKYGAKRSNPDGSIHLHARQLQFEHPTTKEVMKITAPVPDETVWKFFEANFG